MVKFDHRRSRLTQNLLKDIQFGKNNNKRDARNSERGQMIMVSKFTALRWSDSTLKHEVIGQTRYSEHSYCVLKGLSNIWSIKL